MAWTTGMAAGRISTPTSARWPGTGPTRGASSPISPISTARTSPTSANPCACSASSPIRCSRTMRRSISTSSTASAASRIATRCSAARHAPRSRRRWRKAKIGDKPATPILRSPDMADFTDSLTDKHIAFIEKQPVFFTATAAADARINLSPKGYADTFRVLSENRVAYLDFGGSGNETHAHLAADGRITIMFCAFDRSALILRIYGRGRAVLPQDAEWDALAANFTPIPGTRQIFV